MVSASPVTVAEIRAARERIRGRVRETPVLPSTLLSDRLGAPVILKCENLQRTGSFKARGAMNVLASAIEAGRVPSGMVAASAGNHAQGVALAAAEHGIPATILMPRDAPLQKQVATRDYGATVVLVDGPLAQAIEEARALASERSMLFVPPFDDAAVVAGQGTLGLELLEQVPDVETVVVPAGGGGLLAGVATAIKAVRPGVRVVGVQTAVMPGIVASLRSGAPVAVEAARTVADGTAVAGPSALTFDLIQRHVDHVIAVPEEAIARAIVLLIERSRLVVEGAGALGVAAVLSGALTGVVPSPGKTAIVLSGGNIDVTALGRIVARGLLLEGRQRTLTVAAANVPGELARITRAMADAGANVIEVRHEIVTPDLPLGVARLTFRLEVTGAEAFEALLDTLEAHGLRKGVATDLATPAAAAAAW